MSYAKKILIAFDQWLNAVCGGWPDETLSSRSYRWYVAGIRAWPRAVLDTIFFWDVEHCRQSYESERLYRHLPPELRGEYE